jgi:exodeoxyribonuclease-5
MDLVKTKSSITITKRTIATKPNILLDEQKICLDNLKKWYNSNELLYVIAGFAGTGKTYLLKYFINECLKYKLFCISATTHKALRVIENFTGYKGKTIHSLLGLAPNYSLEDFSIDNIKYDYHNQATFNNYKIIIIDECSMINDNLFNYITKQSINYDVKVLFIGDPYQLPPVEKVNGDNINLSKCFLLKNRTVLKNVIRQKDNIIQDYIEILLEDIKNGTNKFIRNYVIKRKSVFEENKGFEILNNKEYEDRIISYCCSPEYHKNINHFRLLSYTNNKCKYYNNLIRNSMYACKDIISINDLFMAYSNIVDKFNKPVIQNSIDYTVKSINDYITDEKIKTYAVNLLDYEKEITTPPLLILDSKNRITIDKFKKMISILIDNKKWKHYFKFREQYLLLDNIKLENGNIIKKDIDYGYCITIHKSQGSTFSNVGVDVQDILNFCSNSKIYNRLIYVALTRCSDKCIIKI